MQKIKDSRVSGKMLFFVFSLVAVNALRAQSDSTHHRTVELPSVQIVASSKELSAIEKLPVSSSVLTGYRLASENIASTSELTARIPNMYMPGYGSRLTSPVYIRGIGSRINAPSVGLYADDIPYFEKSMYDIDLDGVKRVEVLRGPQGTLYGRNTMGGVINIHTWSPFDGQGTQVKLSGGAYEHYSAKATHRLLAGDRLGLSVSAGYSHEGGFFRNVTRNEKAGELDDANAKIRLEYRPNGLWRAAYSGSFGDSRQNGYPYAPIVPASNRTGEIVYNQSSGYSQRVTTHGIHVRRESESTLFASVTAFHWLDDEQKLDQDFTADSVYFATQSQKQVMLSQELTLRSNREDAKYQWLAGAFGFLQNVESRIDVDNYVQQAAEYRLTDVRTSGFALFHQSRINGVSVKGLSLEAGVRMDAEKSNMDYDYLLEMKNGVSESPRVYGRLDFVKVVPRVSTMYEHSDNRWFASVSCGYKTGGFNTAFELDADRSFGPENSINYETGYRSQRIAGFAAVDLSLFYIDWRNQQIYAVNPSGRGSVLRNAGKSHSSGFEVSARVWPAKNLSFDLEYGYTRAVFDRNRKSDSEDYAGKFIPHVPRNTVSLTGLYSMNLRRFVDGITLMAQYSGVGRLFWDETNLSSQDFYGVLNMRAEFRTASRFRFAVWGRNLCNANYNLFDFAVGASRFGQRGMPATAGTSVGVFF
ncbi:MAG: TonB-dependent receptor [Tannerella sp.]|jgi:outer membrane receptor protein involved in Fe transport|nr:TonB-dependent receptor [Tannerella sp.]